MHAMTRREKIVLWMLVLVALAARIFFAWQGQWSTVSDRGIVNLMALHMAEGRAFPVFYYGQSYMGSPEPALSALFVQLFGASGFTVALGTAIPAALLVIPLYFLGRRLGGPAAGALSAAFLALGPDAFLAYMSSPRGGYALTLLFNVLILLVAARLAPAAWQREPLSRRNWMALGLLGGLGWWIGPMVAPALGAAGLVLLVALRGRIWHPGVRWAAAAFALGAAPWLIWNAQHHWRSMSMVQTVGEVRASEALRLLGRRTWEGLGWGAPGWPAGVTLALLLAGLLAVVGAAAWQAVRQRNRAAGWALAAVTLYLLLFGAAYSVSSFSRTGTLRYVLPALPALALLLGLGGALLGRLHRGLLAVALLSLVGPHVYARWTVPQSGERRKEVEAVPEFVRQLKAAGTDAVFAEYKYHWMNFAARGHLPVVEPDGDCVALNDRAGLLARRPAYYRIPAIKHFRNLVRARQEVLDTALGHVVVDLRPAPESWRALLPEDVLSVTASPETAPPRWAGDTLADDWVDESRQGQPPPTITLTFRRPVSLAGLLLYSRTGDYPLYVSLAGRAGPEALWQNLVPDSPTTEWYWSGPQAYCRDLYQSLEVRCPPTLVTEVQLRIPPSPNRFAYAFRLSGLVALEATDGPADPPPPDLDALVAACRAHQVRQLYANRWVADRIAGRRLPDLATDHSARLRRRTSDPRDLPPHLYSSVSNLAGAAFFSTPGALARNLQMLEADRHQVERVPVPGGEVLVVQTPAPAAPPLVWMGDLLMRAAPP